MFEDFNIDNYEKKFLEKGFTKVGSEFDFEYECDACEDTHTAQVFQKDGLKYYFNYEYKDVIQVL